MADKNLTIKKATDKELNEILMRLRKEREVLSLVGDMKRMTRTQEEVAMANTYGYNYDVLDVSTEVPVDKMYHTDEELKSFLHGLIKSGNEELLKHAGILGMKWGSRRATDRALGKTGKLKPIPKHLSDNEKAKAISKKGLKNMSNDEINTVLKRMNLEKQMKEMNIAKLKRGEEMMKTVLSIGTTVSAIYGLSKTPLGEAIVKKLTRRS